MGFNAALAVLTSPITWIIAAIAALIAIGVLLYQNWDTVVEFAKTAWQGLCDFISGICQAIGEFFSGLWTKLQEIFEPIGQWFGEIPASMGRHCKHILWHRRVVLWCIPRCMGRYR